jgi:ABC-2 type transport system ATP-binding protein
VIGTTPGTLMSEPVVDIQNVVKRFAGHTAVKNVSLRVPRGVVYGLLGPNGAGKTTTIRMMLNIIAPDEGQIFVFGKPSKTPGTTDHIGYLPEERGLYRKMQVRRLLRFLAELKGVSRKVADTRIDHWMERLGLRTADKDWGTAKVDDLSRGMQQKVQFIGTLLHDPELVILDEPFSGLDPINAQALKDTVVELRRNGKTVIFSTHLMDNAERLCDSVCIIARGEIVLDGPLGEVKAKARGPSCGAVHRGAERQHRRHLRRYLARQARERLESLPRGRTRGRRRSPGAAAPRGECRRAGTALRADPALTAPDLPRSRGGDGS